ncbi:uncharacterized protein GS458_0014 [Geobacillus stearothermophilus]|nr:uncharacterized protein GS458_0014 [Geobacillus stearothermophilus]
MQIHVIQRGQTLSGIAKAYETTVEDIVRANKLPNPDRLVVGQALVIPIVGRFYWVQPGDSLWSIARRFSIPMQRLAEVNRLSLNAPLRVGQRLYIPPGAKRRAEFNAYIEPRGATVSPALEASAREAAPHLTYLSPFYFAIRRDATLQEPPLDDFPAIARANRVTLVMVVANIENGQFSDELGALILTNETLQNRLLDNIVATARRYGLRAIHFNFEYLRPEDREAYNAFLRKAKRRFEREGWMMSTALAPKTSATQRGRWYEAHDYRAHGQIADFVVIMTYEWGYSGGPPMPVSPIGPVRRVLEYAVSEMPPGKILMGQNLYGYDWTLPYVPGGPYARAISPQQAIALAARYNVAIEYDTEAQAPHFRYRDENGREHEVWFEDARSIQAKFNLVKELGLRGVSYWKLGFDFPQNWLLLSDQFAVVKR